LGETVLQTHSQMGKAGAEVSSPTHVAAYLAGIIPTGKVPDKDKGHLLAIAHDCDFYIRKKRPPPPPAPGPAPEDARVALERREAHDRREAMERAQELEVERQRKARAKEERRRKEEEEERRQSSGHAAQAAARAAAREPAPWPVARGQAPAG
jgi:type IV secretory pathway VirB10-like protein